jgi:hypothetical protein
MVMCFAAREHNFTGRFQYASVLLAFNENLGSAGSSMEQYGTHHLSEVPAEVKYKGTMHRDSLKRTS